MPLQHDFLLGHVILTFDVLQLFFIVLVFLGQFLRRDLVAINVSQLDIHVVFDEVGIFIVHVQAISLEDLLGRIHEIKRLVLTRVKSNLKHELRQQNIRTKIQNHSQRRPLRNATLMASGQVPVSSQHFLI